MELIRIKSLSFEAITLLFLDEEIGTPSELKDYDLKGKDKAPIVQDFGFAFLALAIFPLLFVDFNSYLRDKENTDIFITAHLIVILNALMIGNYFLLIFPLPENTAMDLILALPPLVTLAVGYLTFHSIRNSISRGLIKDGREKRILTWKRKK